MNEMGNILSFTHILLITNCDTKALFFTDESEHTVTRIWNWSDRCVLGHFVTQKFCLHITCETYLALEWAPKSFWPTGFEKSKIHQANPQKLQFKESKIKYFCLDFSNFLKIKQKGSNLASFKWEFLKIGLMNFRFLKACGSGRLWSTF